VTGTLIRLAVGLAVVLSLIVLACSGPAASGTGSVSIWLAADIRGQENLRTLEIVVDSAGVHPFGRPIETDWVIWQPERSQVDLMALADGRTIRLGAGHVPAGPYDRARVVLEAGQARAANDTLLPLTLTVEPIAIPFELGPEDQVEITLELIAMPQANGGYELFTKAAMINRRR
jgi:hypothetical protein